MRAASQTVGGPESSAAVVRWEARGPTVLAMRAVRSPRLMAYDEDIAHRLRELLADEAGVTEKKMFGGLAFLLRGNMCVSASRNGGILVRIDPADTDAALARAQVSLMQMGGRGMDGWITVAPAGLKTKRDLAGWVKRALTFARTLPPKSRAKAPRRAG
jgi:TfoX/Sxy family transcriptional regulator of competence genes